MNNDIFSFELALKTLKPVQNAGDYYLSIGDIHLLIPESIRFDFCITEGNLEPQKDGTFIIRANIYDHDDDVFASEYEELGIFPKQMTYDFFCSRLDQMKVVEVYTEFVNTYTEECIPLSLISLELIFEDGSKSIDITDKITPECQKALKELTQKEVLKCQTGRISSS